MALINRRLTLAFWYQPTGYWATQLCPDPHSLKRKYYKGDAQTKKWWKSERRNQKT